MRGSDETLERGPARFRAGVLLSCLLLFIVPCAFGGYRWVHTADPNGNWRADGQEVETALEIFSGWNNVYVNYWLRLCPGGEWVRVGYSNNEPPNRDGQWHWLWREYNGGSVCHYEWLGAYRVDASEQDGKGLTDPPEPNDSDAGCANSKEPINTITENMHFDQTDVVIPAPEFDLALYRTYNSGLDATNGIFGANWAHAFGWSLVQTSSVFETVEIVVTNASLQIHTGDGRTYSLSECATNATAWLKAWRSHGECPWHAHQDTNQNIDVEVPSGLVYRFDTNGVLKKMVGRWGNTLTLTYTNAVQTGLLARVQHNNGQYLAFAYDGNDRVTNVTTPSAGFYVNYSYSAAGDLTNVTRHTSDGAQSTTYRCDTTGSHCITQRVNAIGHVFTYQYATNDSGDMISRCTNMVLQTNYYHHSVSYQTNNGRSVLTYYRSGTALVFTNYYDSELARITTIHGPNTTNFVVTHAHDRLHFDTTQTVTRIANPSEWVDSRFQYDTWHNVTNTALGYCATPSNYWGTQWDYDADLPSLVTDPEGHKTAYAYTNGALKTGKLYYSTTNYYQTKYSYYTNGLLKAVTNANNHWVKYEYDQYGRLSKTEPQVGPVLQYSNNVLGHLVKITMPGASGSRVTEFDPDELGRVQSITYPDESEEQFQYDGVGNLTNHIDRAGRVTKYTYLPTKKLSSVTRSLQTNSLTTSFCYDNQFNTLKITDAENRPVETYVLDDQDRVVAVTNLEEQTMTVSYGVKDFVRSVSRFDGTVVSNTYEGNGWLSGVKYPDSTNSFTYLMNGLVVKSINPTCTISNTWNFANRLTGVKVSGLTPSASIVGYTYDPAGNVTDVTSPAGTNEYSFDAAERVTAIQSGALKFNHSYNTNDGLVAEVECTNSGVTVTYQRDVMDRTTNIVWQDADTNVIRSFAYQYSSAGMITNILLADGTRRVYSYDSLDRLTGEKVFDGTNLESDVGYSYDSVGNRLTKTRTGISVNYSYQSGCNRLTSWSATSTNSFASLRSTDVSGHSSETIGLNTNLGQRYVASGVATALCAVSGSTNFSASAFLLSLGTNQLVAAIGDEAGNVGYATNTAVVNVITNGTYSYNEAGCVTNIGYEGTGGYSRNLGLTWNSQYQLAAAYTNGTLAESHAFDALGRRVKTISGGVTNFYVYDGAQVVADLNATGGLVRTYVWGPGIDNMLAMTVYTGATAVSYFPIKDHLGTIHALVNTNGAIVERYSFNAWGLLLGVYNSSNQQLNNSAIGNRYLWQGREYSWKTGLYYFRARWYSAVEGRWLSNDPIGINGGLDQYVFAANDPVNCRDSFGKDTYRQNREIGGRDVRSNSNPATHTFVFTTNPDGSVEHTYSWGNEANTHGWNIDRPEDIAVANEALKKPDSLVKVGCEDLDPFVGRAFDILNDPELEHRWWPWNQCKTEADSLVEAAKWLQSKSNREILGRP